MTKRIASVGAGALGGCVGGTLAPLGHDVTLIDPWPENVETIRSRGLELDGMTPEERFTVKKAKILHLTEVQALGRTPIDVAMVAMKSYDTAWATHLIAPYLSPQGFIVSLQNCMNEETIAGIVGWGRVVGVVASLISVDLYEAGRPRPLNAGVRQQPRDPPLPDQARRRRRARRPGARLPARKNPRHRARAGGARRRRRPRGARRGRRHADPESRFQSTRRHPASVDGAGHDQGPPHRDRADERPDRAQRRRDRRAGTEPRQAHRAGAEDRARPAQAFAFASGRLKSRFAKGGVHEPARKNESGSKSRPQSSEEEKTSRACAGA